MTSVLFRGENLEQFLPYCTEYRDCLACGSRSWQVWARSGSYRAVRCRKCRFIWMRPFLNLEGLTKYYTDYIGRRRLSNKVKMKQRAIQYQTDTAFVERYITRGRVLDVGCSGGFFLAALNPLFNKHGVEVDPEAAAYARAHMPFGKQVHCIALEKAPYRAGFFDLVMMRGTIEHLPDPVASLRAVRRLLRKGGYFYITATPNGDSFAAEVYRDQWGLFHPVQHIWHFSPRTLGMICERVGLRMIATDFPYLGTPYENVEKDVAAMAHALRRRAAGESVQTLSPPFWESMMSIVFQKV